MSLWMNSNYVKEGDYFLVDKNNEKYVSSAILNGAAKIITELDETYDIETLKVKSIKDYLKASYYNKISDMTLIGITGTNGKTTTCYLIYQIAKMLNIKCAYIGTIGFYLEDKVYPVNNTTPGMDVLYNMLLKCYEKGCSLVVMETSSHALKQERTYGLLYDAIAVTNITQDHLDYHKSMKDYILSKKKIINMTRNKKICILNGTDKYYKEFIDENNKNIIINKDIKLNNIKLDINKTTFKIKDTYEKEFNIPLVGKFNIYNFLTAYLIMKYLGYDISKIDEKLLMLKEPPGRMDKINYKENAIFIDYAHTPDAVEKVLKTVRKIKNKGIITIIGCGGDRDKTKRPLMAKVACRLSNKVIFTNDNPRGEDEKEIMKDILKGAKKNYEVIYDRYDAIKRGIELLDNNMILMVLGKGHEDYQIIGDTKYYFSDIETVRNIIKK